MDRNKETAVLRTIDEVIPIVQESGRSALAITLCQAAIEDIIKERDALAEKVEMLRDKIRELRYEQNCAGCPDEKRCHEDAVECERMWDDE